jgi:uncharacterized protein YgbK (DUF1537 family)
MLASALDRRIEQGETLLVVDALTDSDLESIVDATRAGDVLLCGSAGMVKPLTARLPTQESGVRRTPSLVAPGPILAVVGSGSEIAHAQVGQVASAGAMRVRTLNKSWHEVDLVGAQCHPVGDWLLHLAPPPSGASLEGAVARAEAARLADLTFAAVDRLQPAVLLVVGGDTSTYVLRRLGIERLAVAEELLPGVALTFSAGRNEERRAVVLKPGNFGDVDTLVTLQRALHDRQYAR